MKRAWVYAVSAVVVVTAGVWLLPHAPSTPEEAAPEAIALSPLDAKVQEAVAIIQSGEGNPMQAIFALREVVEEEPTHRDAQFYLGQFSMLSGQFDKAVERFEIVLQTYGDDEAAAVGLAQARSQMGDTEGAIQGLQTFFNRISQHTRCLQLADPFSGIASGNDGGKRT
jgi:cytochrome c-type biogenesis protein CcmH/NrfG